jgi:hypothetical protein
VIGVCWGSGPEKFRRVKSQQRVGIFSRAHSAPCVASLKKIKKEKGCFAVLIVVV